jgi:hypothetical protein
MQTSNLMKTLLSKAAILACEDLPTTDVDVPEWGGTVRVKGMTGAQRDAFEDSLFIDVPSADGKTIARKQDTKNIRAKLVAASLVDAEGAALFTQAEIDTLAQKSARALSRVFEAAQRLNGMTPEAKEEAKNASAPGQSGASTSA